MKDDQFKFLIPEGKERQVSRDIRIIIQASKIEGKMVLRQNFLPPIAISKLEFRGVGQTKRGDRGCRC